MSQAVRVLAGSIATIVVLALSSQVLQAQSPTVVMFYGGALKQPVFVTERDAASFNNLITPSSITVKDLGDRPYVPVALFWAGRADPAQNGTHVLADLKPEMAWQHGRFYPAAPGKPAILLTTQLKKAAQPVPLPSNGAAFGWGGLVSENALAALKRLAIVR